MENKDAKQNGNLKPPRKQIKMKLTGKSLVMWLIVLFVGVPILARLFVPSETGEEIPLSTAITDIKNSQVAKVEVTGDTFNLEYKDGTKKMARKEPGASVTEMLVNSGIDPAATELQVEDTSMSRLWAELLFNLLPVIGLGVLLLYLFRSARGAQDSLFSFGQSRAKLFDKGKPKVKFADVAGVDEAKKELEEVVDFLKHPAKYRALGARTPKGVLLVGPSGVGKTLLAKAVAGEANAPFYSMAGSEFMEMLVGVGASRVRDLFATAKKNAPAIIFIDEIDAIGRQRGSSMAGGGHDEREQTLNQILVEMDGFNPNDNVIVLAATNRGDLLDSALMRPGRFDRRVQLDMPDLQGRKDILKIHAMNKPFEENVDWEKVAKRTVGFSGADLENMLNEAAILAAREDKKKIDMHDLEEAATKVKLGPAKNRAQSEYEKKMTAYHEAGHALVSFYLPRIDPVHRISIVSRGMALGYTLVPPAADRVQETKSRLLEMMSMMLGGRAAEEIVFKELTGGAASDLDKASRVARNMVTVYGMSDLGPVYFGPQINVSEGGRSWYDQAQISDEMLSKVDVEITKILETAYMQAVDVLKRKRKKLEIIAEKLLEVETLEGEEFEKLIGEPRPVINEDGKVELVES